MVSRFAVRTALIMWILTVALVLAAIGNVALEPTPGAWRGVGGALIPMGIWFSIWRQRRQTLDGTLDQRSS
ncbi:MAG TPA: hypothetical protein PLY94_07395 [Gemmatimonadaceae bacterium]|nr:hypothetical protein [Gemmatimonadaceae bacterium]